MISIFSGNISKIRTKYETDREKFPNLQAIILHEKSTNTTSVQNSATDAIMWLKRGLTFVKEFLKNVTQGEEDLTKALQVRIAKFLELHCFTNVYIMTPRMLTPAVWRDITAGSSEVFFIWQSKARVKTTNFFYLRFSIFDPKISGSVLQRFH